MTQREVLPDRRARTSVEFSHYGHEFVGGAGHYPDGRIGEVFLSSGKIGSHQEIATKDAAIAASIALQFGAPIDVLRHAFLRKEDGTAAGPLGHMLDILAEGGPHA